MGFHLRPKRQVFFKSFAIAPFQTVFALQRSVSLWSHGSSFCRDLSPPMGIESGLILFVGAFYFHFVPPVFLTEEIFAFPFLSGFLGHVPVSLKPFHRFLGFEGLVLTAGFQAFHQESVALAVEGFAFVEAVYGCFLSGL